jgi:hypothetical protein
MMLGALNAGLALEFVEKGTVDAKAVVSILGLVAQGMVTVIPHVLIGLSPLRRPCLGQRSGVRSITSLRVID